MKFRPLRWFGNSLAATVFIDKMSGSPIRTAFNFYAIRFLLYNV